MGRINVLAFLLILAVGIGIGFAIGGLVDLGPKSRNPAETGTRAAPSDQPAAGPNRVRTLETRESESPGSPTARTNEDVDALFTPALLAYFTDEIRKAWRASRDEEIPPEDAAAALEECKRQTLELPGGIGCSRAEMRTKEEKASAAKMKGDASGFIAELKDGRAAVGWDETPAVLDRMVARRGAGTAVDGVSFAQSGRKVEDQITLQFPAGCYTLDSRRIHDDRSGDVPADLQISGAGMNATLIRIGAISPRGSPLTRLSLRDLTIFSDQGAIFDVRVGALSADFERVRMIGFDCGAGGSYVFDVPNSGIAARFTSCEILGGFGRSPGSGYLMRNGPAVMLFQGCRLERFNLALDSLGSGSRVLFQNCAFSLMTNPMTNPPATVRFSGCSVQDERTSTQMREPAIPRPVTELFPNCR